MTLFECYICSSRESASNSLCCETLGFRSSCYCGRWIPKLGRGTNYVLVTAICTCNPTRECMMNRSLPSRIWTHTTCVKVKLTCILQHSPGFPSEEKCWDLLDTLASQHQNPSCSLHLHLPKCEQSWKNGNRMEYIETTGTGKSPAGWRQVQATSPDPVRRLLCGNALASWQRLPWHGRCMPDVRALAAKATALPSPKAAD